MSDPEFFGPAGQVLDRTDDGRFALSSNEYAPWSVRWTRPRSGPIFVAVGGRSEELTRAEDGTYQLPVAALEEERGLRNVRPAAGLLRLWESPDCTGEPLTPALQIQPSVPRQFHLALLNDLGRLLRSGSPRALCFDPTLVKPPWTVAR